MLVILGSLPPSSENRDKRFATVTEIWGNVNSKPGEARWYIFLAAPVEIIKIYIFFLTPASQKNCQP